MSRQTKILLGLIILLAAFIRLYSALRCGAIPDYSDMAIYNEAALAGGIPSYPPPGYPLFLRAVYSLAGPLDYTAVFLVQSVFSVAAVLLIFLTARNIAGARAGLFAAFIAAVYPKFIAYNLTTMTESLSVFVAILMAYLVTSDRRLKMRSALSGAVVFIGFLIKPAFLFFVPGLLAASRKRLVLIAALAVTFGSFFVYGMVTGNSEKRGAMMLYKAYNPLAARTRSFDMEETELGAKGDATDEEYLEAVRDFVTGEKWMTFDIIYGKASVLVSRGWTRFVLKDVVGKSNFLNQYMMYAYLPVLVLGLTGMVRFSSSGTRRLTLLIFSYAILHILVTIFKQRYRLPIEPMLVVLAGLPLAAIPLKRLQSFSGIISRIVSRGKSILVSARSAASSAREAGGELLEALRADLDLILVILFLALGLRIYFAIAIDVQNLPQASLALNTLAIKGGFSASDAPLYPLFLRTVYSIFGRNDFTAVFIIQGLIDSATVLMLYIIAARVFSRRAGLIAAATAAIYPRSIIYCISVKTVSFGIFFAAALLLILTLRTRGRARGVLSGAAVSLAVLTSPIYAWLVPGTAAVLKGSRKAFFMTLLVLLAPLVVRNSATSGELVPVYRHTSYVVDLGKFAKPDHPRMLNAIYSNVSAFIGRDWRDNYSNKLDSGVRNFNYINSYSYIAIVLAGIFALIRYGKKAHMKYFLPVFGYILLLILFSDMRGRLQARALVEPVMIIYTAALLTRGREDKRAPESLA